MKTAELTNKDSPNNFFNNRHSDPSPHLQNVLPKSPATLFRPDYLHTILSRTALFYSMREKRAASAGAFHPEHGWLISGGFDGPRRFSSCEVTRDGISFEEFPALPNTIHGHSIVALDGDNGDFLVTGGDISIQLRSARTFIFKNEWTEVARMPTARYSKKPNLQGG